jgi:serine/threonine protein kinase
LAECAGGALDAAAAAEIRLHVAGCTYCRTVLDAFLRAIAAPTSAYPPDPVPGGSAFSAKPPRRLRDYVLADKLGEGGMGAVYKAFHTRLDRVVAVKVLPSHRLRDPNALARFEREMKAVGRLDHPNIVRATDAGEADGVQFLVMEYLEGTDLDALVKRSGPLSIARACEIVRQAALGLQHAHEQGLVHRDIKPSNLIVTPGGQVKVLDLGLALLQGGADGDLTRSSQVMGTLDYMAPEQASKGRCVDARADLYSLGCTLYKLLCGDAPFADSSLDTPLRKMMAHAQEPHPPLRSRRPEVPQALAAVVDRLMAKDPNRRFASAAEVAGALLPFTSGETGNAATLPVRCPQQHEPRPDEAVASPWHRLVVRVLGFIGLAIVLAGAVWLGFSGLANGLFHSTVVSTKARPALPPSAP